MEKPTDPTKALIKILIPENILHQDLEKEIIDYIDFRRELTKESDRGCALLAASHLDYLLELMLKSKLIGTPKQLDSLFDFNGPLGTFSAKILMSFSLGLISKVRMNDLQTIRKIRNDFGHSASVINFTSEKINSLCNNLKLIRKSNNCARSKFITSVGFVSGAIMAEKFKDKKFELVDNLDDNRIKEIQGITEYFENILRNKE